MSDTEARLSTPRIKPASKGGRYWDDIKQETDDRICALVAHLDDMPIDATRLLDPALIDELAADLCDQAQRPGRTQYHWKSWDEAGRQNAGPPESTKREWWRHYAKEVLAWAAERLTEDAPVAVPSGGKTP